MPRSSGCRPELQVRQQRTTMSVATHLGIDLAEYDARIRTFIPGYETLLRTVALTVRTSTRGRAPVVVDLGTGTGALSAACLECIPGARITGIDEDEEMLAAARTRLGRRLRSAVHGSFESAAIQRGDAIIASLALHHVPTPARRLRLFRRIHAALRPGGMLISADCHPPSHPRLAGVARAEWFAHLEQSYP